MNKNGFELRVTDYSKSTIDWQQEAFEDGISIGIEAYDEYGAMVDDHICEQFEELEMIDLMDEAEGYMSYEGELSANKLVEKLTSMGFNAKLN